MVLCGLTQTIERSSVTDMSIPFIEELITLVAPVRTGVETQLWVYAEIFPMESWYLIGAMVLITALGFFAIRSSGVILLPFSGIAYLFNYSLKYDSSIISRVLGLDTLHREEDSEKFNGLNGIALVLLIMIQIGYDVTIKSHSGMMLLIVTAAGTWLIFTYYTSELTAKMTARDVCK